MIEADGLFFEYDDFRGRVKKLLCDVSFKVEKGERVVLLGINGSGKSTLLKILNGLIFPKEGVYRFKGEEINKKSIKKLSKEFRKDVVFLMQDPNSMLFNATVREEIAFGLQAFGFEDVDDRVGEIAKRFNLEKFLDTPPFYLSGGEKQKVALAALLAIEPKVLLMDEPTSQLDPPTTGWLVDLLSELDVTTIISTHNLSLASELGQRALVLSPEHKLLYDGALETFLNDLERLKEAKLLHKHRHKHGEVEHSHFHIHSWKI